MNMLHVPQHTVTQFQPSGGPSLIESSTVNGAVPKFRYMRSIKKALRGCIIMHSLDALSTALSLLSHKCLVGEYLNVEFCPDHCRGGLKRHNPRASFRSSQPATTDTLQRTTQSFRASGRSMPQANRSVAATAKTQRCTSTLSIESLLSIIYNN